jgi:hypothetical protein
MPRSQRPRKGYRPHGVRLDAHGLAMDLVTVLSAEQQAKMLQPAQAALETMRTGRGSWDAWRHLADCVNVCQALCAKGIGSNLIDKCLDAQQALGDLHARVTSGGSWTLRGTELKALDETVWLHEVQLRHATQGELQAAIDKVRNVVRGALTGGSQHGPHVLVGRLGP